MRRYTTMPELGIWYDGMHVDRLMSYYEPADRGQVKIHIEKQRRRRTSRGAFAKLTTMAQGRPRISTDPPLRVTISDEEQADLVDHFLAEYRLTPPGGPPDSVRPVQRGRYRLFLQVKQAGPSEYESHTKPSRYDNHGARVINGKRLVQTATDIFVGWGSFHGRDYYVRQFRDMKIIPTTTLIAPQLTEFATACGEALARAHARTGDPVAINGYIGTGPKFAAAIGRFARVYADQNERDHAQLVQASAAGAVESLPG